MKQKKRKPTKKNSSTMFISSNCTIAHPTIPEPIMSKNLLEFRKHRQMQQQQQQQQQPQQPYSPFRIKTGANILQEVEAYLMENNYSVPEKKSTPLATPPHRLKATKVVHNDPMHFVNAPPELPTKMDYSGGYLKHITYHEAKKEAQAPMREAQKRAKDLTNMVTTLTSRFEIFRIEQSTRNLFKLCTFIYMRNVVSKRFAYWQALCGLDVLSRKNRIRNVPKVMLSWLNRKQSVAFKKWKNVVSEEKEIIQKITCTRLVMKMLLRKKFRELKQSAWRKLSKNLFFRGGDEQQGGGKEQQQQQQQQQQNHSHLYSGFDNVSWTEVPPSPFILH